MRIFRDAAYLLVAAGSVGMAVCQPFDASSDNVSTTPAAAQLHSGRPLTIETVPTSVDRAIRFSPGLKV